MKTKIYLLEDPRIYNINCYVGQTASELKSRLQGHLSNPLETNKQKREWINDLKKNNLQPKISLIEEVDSTNAREKELFWIAAFAKSEYNISMNSAQDIYLGLLKYCNVKSFTNNINTGLKKQIIFHAKQILKDKYEHPCYMPEISFACPSSFITKDTKDNYYIKKCVQWLKALYFHDTTVELKKRMDLFLTLVSDYNSLLSDPVFLDVYYILLNIGFPIDIENDIYLYNFNYEFTSGLDGPVLDFIYNYWEEFENIDFEFDFYEKIFKASSGLSITTQNYINQSMGKLFNVFLSDNRHVLIS
jgi:hypothetical protein